MRSRILSLLAATLFAVGIVPSLAIAQGAGSAINAYTVTACGTPPQTYTAGQTYQVLQDIHGVLCAPGGSGTPSVVTGNVSNGADAVAPTTTNIGTDAFNYGWNGTGWDRLQVDASKFLKVILQAGVAIIGKVGIDQTTPGTTNGVQIVGSLPATTPSAGTATTIVSGGVAVTLVTGPVNGCYIVNPLSAADQGIVTAEVAYVNGVTTATAAGNGTNANLAAGQPWQCAPGQTTNVSAIAATTGHKFTVVKW